MALGKLSKFVKNNKNAKSKGENKVLNLMEKLNELRATYKLLSIKKQLSYEEAKKMLDTELEIDEYKERWNKLTSKNIFGSENKLKEVKDKINNISENYTGNVIPSKVCSKGINYFRVIISPNYSFDKISRESVKIFGKKISKILKNNGLTGTIETVLDFDGSIRSGSLTKIGDEISIFNIK